MDVFCVGMYRSGSTWQYQVASELIEAHHRGQRLGFVAGDDYDTAGVPGLWRVLKAHDRHHGFGRVLEERCARAIYSYRDLRDVAYSLMHKMAASFDTIVVRRRMLEQCLENDRFWRGQPGVLCQRYEDIIADPVEAVLEIAEHLDVALSGQDAMELAEKYSLAQNRQRAGTLAEQLHRQGVDLTAPKNAERWDRESLLHWNHIRDGGQGGWRREAKPRELAILARVCGGWLVQHGYEPDLAWAAAALSAFPEKRNRPPARWLARLMRRVFRPLRATFTPARLP